MITRLLFLSTILFSFSINAQIDFEAHIIVDSHPDVVGPYTLVSADIDGDGDKDLLATSTFGNKLVWLENLDGQGDFSEPKVITSNMDYPLDIAAADLDGDGDLDVIAVSTYDDKVAWFENLDGLGTFSALKLVTILEYAQTVKAMDMDGDGDIDIIAGGDNKVIWLENLDGLGTFGPEKIVSNVIVTTESIKVGDIDGDGDMDVAVADWGLGVVSWYENTDGLGTFGPEKIIDSDALATNTVIIKDMDHDGDLDVASVSYGNYIAWFKNIDGLGNFGPPIIISSNPVFTYKLFAEDLDSDGDNDIIASIFDSGEIIWLENDGTGNFSTPHIIYSNASNPIGVIADDFNGDGKMDAAGGIFGSNKVIWFENRGPLGIEENTTALFSIYPNPTKGILNISSTISIAEISIYNNLGQLLFTSEETNQIDISTLDKGIYFVKIKCENGQIETKKIIKN
jgi:hypothetical protein